MNYIDYVQLNPFQKFGYNFVKFFKALPGNLKKIFCAIGRFFKRIFLTIGKGFAGYFSRFVKGDWATKCSYLIMGVGNASKGQLVKGFLFLLVEVAYILFMIFFGWGYLVKFPTLGTVSPVDENGRRVKGIVPDNSMLILLYGVMTIIVTVLFFCVYIANTKSAYKAQQTVAEGKKPIGFKDEMKEFLDSKFHVTLLAFPTLTISVFTILPLIFMILIAFTNFDSDHNELAHLFTWVGFDTFRQVFETSGRASMGATFIELTEWTLIWAVFATVLNYILGMVVALMINKKGIKLKALWRTLFVVTVAVPQFVSLLLMSQMLNVNDGAINTLLCEVLHIIPQHIDFLGGDPTVARITVIVVNCWVGIPYTILITSGILMNIPADLYESATIDGAGPVKSFFSITLPYMLFVTTPYLITSFVGNINNFNVIYLLTSNLQNSNDLYKAGHTDLLVTWLFKLTMNEHDYNLAAAIGILVFIVCATISLLTFNLTKSAKNEEEFS
ncbi:carbohydrate ABC transporter permease [Ruminococcus difficilis]|uniref:Maltose/maltodextrin transport system permease protein n=1 Tax=Ruminococcus difficilis TaxID=2763069 RepID=A0A934TZ96_9FIRM|nr:sugar ABC transporter permease [Ruminococcus difficilis]MBK6087568.1 sugar ABC transporter permease [Ruminococcus difficilis]